MPMHELYLLFLFILFLQSKCVQYWPDTGSQKYGEITVSMEQEQVKADYVIRKFKVVKVVHFRYLVVG